MGYKYRKTKDLLAKTRSFKIIGAALLVSTIQFCSQGRLDFQTFEPESDVRLTELFNETAVIRSAFNGLDANTFNEKMTALMHRNPTASLKFLLAFADLADSSNPANPAPLPKIFDSLSYDIGQLASYYNTQERQDFDTAMNVGSRILDIDPTAITQGTNTLAKIIHYMGDLNVLFPDDNINSPPGNNMFPSETLWKRCKDPNGDFSNAMVVSQSDGRNTLSSLYDVLRIAYCLYEGREPASEQPGDFMRKLFITVLDAGDVENRMNNMAHDFNDDQKISELRDTEETLADWLLLDPNKIEVTDFLTSHGLTVLRKETIFKDGKPVLDLEAAHLSQINPGFADIADVKDYNKPEREYLVEWLLDSLYEDSTLLDKLDNDVITDLTAIYANPLYDFGYQMVHNATYGYKKALTAYTQPRMREILWSGWVYDAYTGTDPSIKGLLYNDGIPGPINDGPVSQMAQTVSTQKFKNHYRTKMASQLASVLSVPTTYDNESQLAAILKNLYYYLMSNYYNTSLNRWALDANDAQTYFNDPERSLLKYIGSLQYSIRNSSMLNPYGEAVGVAPSWALEPGKSNADYLKLPYLSALLYTIASSNGLVDQQNAPSELTLRKSLASMGAPIDSNGIRTINLPLGLDPMKVQVACPGAPPCKTMVWRNGDDYTTALDMFDFELLSPGRYKSRTGHSGPGGFTDNGWRGTFSQHQGDIETTKLKTSNWVMVEMALNLWEGYGPYSYKGKAANGSKVKYRNDYITDKYKIRIDYRPSWSSGMTNMMVAMGSNAGFEDGSGDNKNGSIVQGQGNYHVYERIYIPQDNSQPCWVDAIAGGSYPKYGFIRPQDNQTYWDIGNCASWEKIQVDFDTIEEAIAANMEWLLKYKKYTFVIPLSGSTDMCVLGVCNGAAFGVVSTINANGVYGVTNAKRACGGITCNGKWGVSGVNMSANGSGLIPNLGKGFIPESNANGGNRTIRFGVTSFAAADSNIVLEINGRYWGLAMTLIDVMAEIWDSLGNGPVTPAIVGENFAPILAMADARYTPSDLMTTPSQGNTTSMAKFKKFYDTYFPTNETSCSAGVIINAPNGTPDLFENFQNGCIRAMDLPPLPRVNPSMVTCKPSSTATCIKYPLTYTAGGDVATWYPYTGASESRFSGILLPFAMIVGTMHEDGGIVKPNGSLLGTNEDRDITGVKSFETNGFRQHVDTLLTVFTSLNEARRQSSNNLPEYNTTSLINLLTETSKGARNGLIAKLATAKYANVSYLDPVIDDTESMLRTLTQNTMNQFELLKGNNVGTVKNIDKLRFFLTKKVIDEGVFPSNRLGKDTNGKPDGTSDEPINELKSFIQYIRTITDDAEVEAAVKAAIPALNSYFELTNANITLNVSDADIDKVLGFLNAKSSTDEYIIDGLLDLVVSLKLADLRQIYDFKFDNFKDLGTGNFAEQIDDVNRTIDEYFGENYKKKLLYSSFMLGEPSCPGVTGYLDYNNDGTYNRGILQFVNAANTGTQFIERTNTGTICNVTINEPNIYEPHYYVLNMDNAVWYLNDGINTLTEADVDSALTTIFDADFNQDIIDLKHDIFDEIYEKKVAEPSVDRNKNGVVDPDEYTDINGNGVYDDENSVTAPTVREVIGYYFSNPDSQFRTTYEDMRDEHYLKAAMHLSDDLFNPINTVNTTCSDDDPYNDEPTCLYISNDLVTMQEQLLGAIDFSADELKAVKKVAGHLFYDSALGEYTYPISNISKELSQLSSGFSGQYESMLDMSIAGFAPDGFLTYLAKMKTAPQYTGLDVLVDLRTLANSQVMRCYTGKTADYCKNKTRDEMFWPQLGSLLRSVAETTYTQHGFKFSTDLNNKYYQQVANQF